MKERQDYLGIEGGGTRTVAIVADTAGVLLRRREFGSGNLRLLAEGDLAALFSAIGHWCPDPICIGAGMAGVRDEADRVRVRKAIQAAWGEVRSVITHDLEIALATEDESAVSKILVLSGTGSCCYGRNEKRLAKVGGWGHLLGDKGSGYDIAMSALKNAVYQFDRHAKFTVLGERLLRSLALNEPNDLIAWIQNATKSEIAALAPIVFETSADPISKHVLRAAGESLARDASICAARLARKSERVTFVFAGSVLLKQPGFAKKVAALIRKDWPQARIGPLKREAAWGAIALARKVSHAPAKSALRKTKAPISGYYFPDFDPARSPTEQRNPASSRFHQLSTGAMIDVMLGAEQAVIPALRLEKARLVKAVDLAFHTLKRGGRIFYVGAGTSGRLGVLDASECPPTFRSPPEMIQGIIAGGQRALWQAVEGAEDDAEAGARALRFRELTARDLVIGIAASGRTPFVWGALGWGQRVGAQTILICFNPALKVNPKHRPTVLLAPNLGPEVLTGSTRLKCGTATKLFLNLISTLAMVRMGKVIGNLMVDLNPSNVKLRDRAVRIVQELTGCSAEEAKATLEETHWMVKEAWAALKQRRTR